MLHVRRIAADLIALRSPLSTEKLRPGQLLQLADGPKAAVLCGRSGTLLASVLPERHGAVPQAIARDGVEASLLPNSILRVPLGSNRLGGRQDQGGGGVASPAL